jgi:8-oxo-dGTP diphosphatase
MTDHPAIETIAVPSRVVAAVIHRSGTWLVCQRATEKRYGGLWEFPGGKVEPGEDDAAALRRELAEELAVTVRRIGQPLLVVHDPGSMYVIIFTEVEIEGIPIPCEHVELRWASLVEIQGLPLAPSDRLFVKMLTSVGPTSTVGQRS